MNYPWLPHNMDPSIPTPYEYEDMVPQPLGDKKTFYKDFVEGCKEKFGKKGKRCVQTELDRIAMTLRQPQSMQNYTKVGYKKNQGSTRRLGIDQKNFGTPTKT